MHNAGTLELKSNILLRLFRNSDGLLSQSETCTFYAELREVTSNTLYGSVAIAPHFVRFEVGVNLEL